MLRGTVLKPIWIVLVNHPKAFCFEADSYSSLSDLHFSFITTEFVGYTYLAIEGFNIACAEVFIDDGQMESNFALNERVVGKLDRCCTNS